MSSLTWKKFHPLTDQNAFICLVDSMGDDSSIVQAARVSYGKDKRGWHDCSICHGTGQESSAVVSEKEAAGRVTVPCRKCNEDINKADRNLIRYLLNHGHTTPFEMVEIKFMVQVPMDCWRQWIRHRTASVNEYSTRYTEALDFFQVTDPSEWRLQATDNKQGSGGFLEEEKGEVFSQVEHHFHNQCVAMYRDRLDAGIAKEQARKDLPLSTYTRAYWKCDLHNIFNFLRLRMDSHAQLEIRQFANCMFEIVKQVCPVACEAFEDYVLNAKKFSRMEMEVLRIQLAGQEFDKPNSMSDREWKEFQDKVS